MLAKVYYWSDPVPREGLPNRAIAEANARLLAAAPELLEMLVALRGRYASDPTNYQVGLRAILMDADAAIAKVEGGGGAKP